MAKEESVDHTHVELEKELAALKKELAALKKELGDVKKDADVAKKDASDAKKEADEAKKSKSGGGADPRLEAFLKVFKEHTPKWARLLEKAGL